MDSNKEMIKTKTEIIEILKEIASSGRPILVSGMLRTGSAFDEVPLYIDCGYAPSLSITEALKGLFNNNKSFDIQKIGQTIKKMRDNKQKDRPTGLGEPSIYPCTRGPYDGITLSCVNTNGGRVSLEIEASDSYHFFDEEEDLEESQYPLITKIDVIDKKGKKQIVYHTPLNEHREEVRDSMQERFVKQLVEYCKTQLKNVIAEEDSNQKRNAEASSLARCVVMGAKAAVLLDNHALEPLYFSKGSVVRHDYLPSSVYICLYSGPYITKFKDGYDVEIMQYGPGPIGEVNAIYTKDEQLDFCPKDESEAILDSFVQDENKTSMEIINAAKQMALRIMKSAGVTEKTSSK